MTDSSESKGVIERYMAAIGAGDVAAVRGSFAPDATWWLRGDLPISGTWDGRDAIIDDFFGTAMSYYEAGSVNIEVTSILADGEHVAAEWTSRARTTDGAPYENHCAAWFHVRDGHIHSVREYMDTKYAAEIAFGRAVSRT
jgi:uncharacterized protein (TIGR02246 family)